VSGQVIAAPNLRLHGVVNLLAEPDLAFGVRDSRMVVYQHQRFSRLRGLLHGLLQRGRPLPAAIHRMGRFHAAHGPPKVARRDMRASQPAGCVIARCLRIEHPAEQLDGVRIRHIRLCILSLLWVHGDWLYARQRRVRAGSRPANVGIVPAGAYARHDGWRKQFLFAGKLLPPVRHQACAT